MPAISDRHFAPIKLAYVGAAPAVVLGAIGG
jgi:hypothetical protein